MSRSPSVRRETYVILAALLALSLASWAVLLWQSQRMASDMGMSEMSAAASLTAGMGVALFLAMWVIMMVAMMFPTAAPMVLMFAQISRGRRARGDASVPTWVFVAAYLVVWTAFGVVAFLVASGLDNLGARWGFLEDNAARIGGGVLALAGLYQLSPLKKACLAKCRTPLQFILTSWREGYSGAFRMGLLHGTYCLGCCWLLFVILFPLGVMNVAAMGLVTLLVFAEKSLPHGEWTGRAVGVGLVVFGLVVVFVPGVLPTSIGGGMDAMATSAMDRLQIAPEV